MTIKSRSLLLLGAAPFAICLAGAAAAQITDATPLTNDPQDQAVNQPQSTDTSTAADVVVTGSRIANPTLTSITPLTVVSAAEVRNQGNVRVEDLLNSLPQVFADQGSTDANGATGIATVNLRNLGATRTLVLINGRRLGSGDPTTVASDLNFIPGALIKRVDVLTGGASATYGSDALAGVVNFVMNSDFEGFQIDAQTSFYNHDNKYGESNYNAALAARGYTPPRGNTVDGAVQTVNITFGAGTSDGRGHLTGYAGWRKVNAITQGDRDYSFCGYSAGTSSGSQYAVCGGSSTSAFGRFRRTTNVALGGSPVYAPTGASFTANPAATPLVPGGFGAFSSGRDGYNFNPVNYFQRPDSRWTAGVFANYEVSKAFKPYMEFMFMDDRTTAQIAASGAFYGTDFFVNCNNPLLTGAQATQLCGANAGTDAIQSLYIGRRNVEGGGRVDDLRHTDYRVVVGAKGDLAEGISYDVYGQLWRALLAETYSNDFSITRLNRSLNVVAGPGGNPVCASTLPNAAGLVEDALCVPYNIFQAGGVSQAALNYLQVPGVQNGTTSQYVVNGAITADLGKYGVTSPFADSGLQVLVGGEYREERLKLQRDVSFLTGDLAGQGTPFGVPNVAGTYNVKEGFVEASLPLVTDKPFFETLGVVGGYRYSDYSVQGSTNTYKVQVEYAPIRQVRFRGGYNRAVRAPNTLELFDAPNVVLFAGQDPCTGASPSATAAQCALTGLDPALYGTLDANPANQYNQQTAGNINLRPEKGDTWTGGVVVNPIRNLTLTVDYFNIKVKDLIGTLGAQYILNQCINAGQLCANVSRGPGGSLFTGTGFVSNPTLNLGSQTTAGVDVTALYRMDLGGGQLSFDLSGTYLDKFTVLPQPGGDAFECAGKFGYAYCGTPLPEWRHKLRVSYTMENGIGLTAAWRYFSSVKNDLRSIDGLAVCPADGTANPDGCVNRQVAKIDAVNYFDLGLVARVAENYTLRIGAQNLLDKTPPVLDSNYSNNGSNVYAQVYDSLGRYVYAAVQLNF